MARAPAPLGARAVSCPCGGCQDRAQVAPLGVPARPPGGEAHGAPRLGLRRGLRRGRPTPGPGAVARLWAEGPGTEEAVHRGRLEADSSSSRRFLQGHAAANVKDAALFRDLLKAVWQGDPATPPKDLCSIAISLAKLKCDAGSFDDLAEHFARERALEGLESIDVSSLANAFSRVSCAHAPFLRALAAQLRQDAAGAAPVAAAMALNAFAVMKHCDKELFEALVTGSVRPCVGDFTMTQAALTVDALARCSEVTEDLARQAFRSFVDHWLRVGQLSFAECEDLARLASSAVRLQVEDAGLNAALARLGLRRVGSFSAAQLGVFCAALARLPSEGREAFLSVAALRALPQALRSMGLVDLALVAQAMATCDITFTSEAVALFQQRLAETAKEELAHLAADRAAELASLAAALERIAEGSKVLAGADGKQLLASIRPLSMDLIARRALRLRTAAALMALHAEFRVRDVALLDALGSISETRISPVLAGRLLRGMAPLGNPVKSLLLLIDDSFGASRGYQRSLPALSADLFAAALLDFAYLSEETINSLLSAAQACCESDAIPSDRALRLKCAAELSAAAHARLRGTAVGESGSAAWLADWAVEVSGSDPQLAPALVPPAPQGLRRSVFAALRRAGQEVPLPGLSAEVGFVSDLATKGGVAVEVNGPERFYLDSVEPLACCRLKHRALSAAFPAVKVSWWEWPSDPAEQDRFLSVDISGLDPVEPVDYEKMLAEAAQMPSRGAEGYEASV
ncbi:unnamed protein product [Effrenium voratum]|uniref:RAP domain-containing protein n=1 Tax=Effrenium voratum TaxID=2562239 RepID=A0AA36MYN9_9DINO|nr:unnamed protein product [Effrenium voratum]